MPPPSKRLQPRPANFSIEETQQRIRDSIESVLRTLLASHRIIEDGREAIARADEVLARQFSERR